MEHEARGATPTKLRFFGERSSGTNFVETLLLANFPSLELVRHYPFEKHAFLNEAYTTPDMVCVCVTRSADMWLKSMYRSKHQIWAWARRTTFSEFLRHEWHSHFSGHILRQKTRALGLRQGQELLLDRHPLTGARIENVLALRGLKLASYLKAPHMHRNYAFVSYEEVVADQESFTRTFGEAFGLEGQAQPITIEKNLSRDQKVLQNKEETLPDYADFSASDLAFVFDNLDFSLEERFGYRYDAEFRLLRDQSVPLAKV
ncbi:MAG: hypothetical protein AAGK71_00640 [Pseudomonadota bacterium]